MLSGGLLQRADLDGGARISCSQRSWLVDLDAIAEGVANEEAPPRCWPSILGGGSRCLQAHSQAVHVCALEPKVPVYIDSATLVLNRNVNVESACVEPNAASGTH